jgi:AcrR family transcriptional regulator
MPPLITSLAQVQRHPTAQRLVDATLDLIEKKGGCRGINIRLIAEQAKCAHTNVYKHFKSVEQLLWAAVDHALERQSTYIRNQMSTTAGATFPMRTFLEAQLDFAQEHPALYRLFWLEPLAPPPPPEVLQRLGEMRAFWINLITRSPEDTRIHLEREWPGPVVHSFFHGEICKLIGRNAFVPKATEARDRIVRLTLRLIDVVSKAI